MYSSKNITSVIKSKRLRRVKYVTLMGVRRYGYNVSIGEPDGRMPFRRSRHRWEDNMKMDIKEI